MMADMRERLSSYKSSDIEDETRLINDLKQKMQEQFRIQRNRKDNDVIIKQLLASILRKREKFILISTMSACRSKLLPIRGLAPSKGGGMRDQNDDIMEIFESIENIPNIPKNFFNALFGKE